MKDKHNDKIEQLKEFQVSLDKEALWAELESRQKKEKRRWLLWLFPGFLFLGGMLLWYTNMNGIAEVLTISENIEPIEKAQPEKIADNKSYDKTEQPLKTSITDENANEKRVEKKTTQRKKIQSRKVKEQKQNEITNAIKQNEVIKKANTEKEPTYTRGLLQSFPAKNRNLALGLETRTIGKTGDTKNKTTPSSTSINTGSEREFLPISIESLTALRQLFLPLDAKPRTLATHSISAINIPVEVIVESGKVSKAFIEVYSGFGFLSRELFDKNNPQETYAAIRSTTETPLDAWHIGLKYGYHLSKKLYLAAGLDFGQLTEKFSYSGPDKQTGQEQEVTHLFIDSFGNSTSSTRIATGTSYAQTNFEIFNRYRTLGIPVSVGWITTSGRWSIGAEAGANFNLSLGFKGRVLNSDLLASSEPIFFKNRIGVSVLAGLDIGYQIHENFTVMLKPSFRNLTNLISEDLSNQIQRYNVYSLGLGLRYKL